MQEIRDYYGLVEALRERRIRLGLPHLEVDAIAGFHNGYTGKHTGQIAYTPGYVIDLSEPEDETEPAAPAIDTGKTEAIH